MRSTCSRSSSMPTRSRRQFAVSRGWTSSWRKRADWCAGMRSSKTVDPGACVGRLLVAGSLLAAACSAPPAATQTVATQAPLECVGGDVAPQDADTVASLRQTVERGPLYTSLTARSAVASCRIGRQSGEVALQYMFGDGARLDVQHDPRIEYNNQEVRFASPPAEDPVELLKRVEQTGFADGCGIDWDQ